MKKITTLLLSLSLLFAFGVKADVLLDETFNYAESDLDNVTAWTKAFNTAPTGTVLASTKKTISAPALVYAPLNEYVLSGLGKKVKVEYDGVGSSNPADANNYRNIRNLTSSVSTDCVYLSFLFQSGNQSQGQSDVISFNRDNTNGPRVWAGRTNPTATGKMRFGVTTGATGSGDIEWGEGMDVNTVYFLVLKHDFSANTTTLYVDPTVDGTEPATGYTYKTAIFSGALNNIAFRLNQGNDANFEISGVRVSTTWAEAVAKKVSDLPELTPPAIGIASGIEAESFVANWTAVEDATGYDVRVYQGTDLIGTYPVTGQATNSLKIEAGLWCTTEYTYTVAAKGDGETFGNSEESSDSTPFTTAVGLTAITANFNDGTWGVIAEGNEFITGRIANGFYLCNAVVRSGTMSNVEGEEHSHTYRISVQGNTSSYVELPIIQSSVSKLEVHASMGTADRSFKIQKSTDGKIWVDLTVFTVTDNNKCYTVTVDIDSDVPVKLRIINNSTSVLYIWQIIASGPNLPTSLHAAGASKNIYSINNTIFTSQAGTLEIYDMKGVRVAHAAITNTYNCDLSKGLYIVRLTTKTGRMYSEKINIK